MREVRWASGEGKGIEHLAFDTSGGTIRVENLVVGQRYGKDSAQAGPFNVWTGDERLHP